ncbi:MAG: SMC-Scp complex subunit ScpB [Chromatiales bacterium]|nr:SMC-Scp complex subunit ScpB [Chromatiales bacterium]
METEQLKYIVEAALLAAARPLDLATLQGLFGDEHPPERDDLRAAIVALQADYENRGITVQEVASGFRIQLRTSMSAWVSHLWEERAPRYSRALMETLSIIAYRQPVTRGDIEEIRGVGVTTNIMRTLLERNWIRVVGFRDVPGKPAIYGTTKDFLDYFGLKRLDELPPLADLKDLESLTAQLDLGDGEVLPGSLADLTGDAESMDDDESDELATVTQISEARGTVVPVHDDETSAHGDGEQHSATVVPIKAR